MTIQIVVISITFLILSYRDPANAQDNLYAGKTIRIVVGSSPLEMVPGFDCLLIGSRQTSLKQCLLTR